MVLALVGTDPEAQQRVLAVRQQVLADRAAFGDAIDIQLRQHVENDGNGVTRSRSLHLVQGEHVHRRSDADAHSALPGRSFCDCRVALGCAARAGAWRCQREWRDTRQHECFWPGDDHLSICELRLLRAMGGTHRFSWFQHQ